MIHREDLRSIGHFGKPHGIKGELFFECDSDSLEEDDISFIFCNIDDCFIPFYVEGIRYVNRRDVLLQLERIKTEEATAQFLNREGYILKEDYHSEENEESWEDLIGYTVTDSRLGVLGAIEDIDDSTMNVLLKIDHNGKELLIPAVPEMITVIDAEKRTMEVQLPEGLTEI